MYLKFKKVIEIFGRLSNNINFASTFSNLYKKLQKGANILLAHGRFEQIDKKVDFVNFVHDLLAWDSEEETAVIDQKTKKVISKKYKAIFKRSELSDGESRFIEDIIASRKDEQLEALTKDIIESNFEVIFFLCRSMTLRS